MIIDFDVDIKNYIENILNFFGFWKYVCPCCGSINSLVRHAKYERYICLFENNVFVCRTIIILRLKCKSCNTTHAILPIDVIPYKIFSFTCIRICLTGYFIEEMSGPEISFMYRISVQMVYLFIKEYRDEQAACINFLRANALEISKETSKDPKNILLFVNTHFPEPDFLRLYFMHTRQVFLMRRRHNPLSKTLWVGG
jgi:uncharacterized protein DUF6431